MTEFFEEIFERSPVALLVVDSAGKITQVNACAEDLFGYGSNDLVGESIERLVPEARRGKHPVLVQQFMASPTPRQMGKGRELFGIRRDGSQIPVEVGLNPIERGGETMVLAAVVDVTDRLRADERFRAAVDAAPNGMLMIHSSGEIVLCNRQIEETFGYGRSELIGKPIELLVPEEIKGVHRGFVEGYLRDPKSRAMGAGRELFGRHKSGKMVPVEIGLQPVEDDGEMFVISSVVDITSRRAAAREIETKTGELEEFAYRTSHDLRSPLKSIAGMMDCIAEDIDDGELDEAKDGVDKVAFLTRKLLTLTKDLLTLTKVDAESAVVAAFDFDDYLKTARMKFSEALQRASVELTHELDHEHRLKTQPTRLTQVLDNLIGNGIKYSNRRRSDSFVCLRTLSTSDEFLVEVEDNGLGIDSSSHGKVFGMFKRFHSASIPGSGLGLYIVKKQVDQLGAEITFRSGSEGTAFQVRLPLAR